jgi:hypothetical protein
MQKRDYILEKRSEIRSKAPKPKIENKKLIGGIFAFVLIFALIFSSYSPKEGIPAQPLPAQKQVKAEATPTPSPSPPSEKKASSNYSSTATFNSKTVTVDDLGNQYEFID